MSKPKRKLPIAPIPEPVAISISDVDWERIERASGHQLSPDMRRDVCEVTEAFAEADSMVQAAESPEDVKAILDSCRRAAHKFQQTLVKQVFKATDAGDCARFLIKRNFSDACDRARSVVKNFDRPALHTEDKPLDALFSFLCAFRFACALALRDTKDIRGFEEGFGAWRVWISRLIDIWNANGLKVAVRKDSGGGQSPFVEFVIELQKCLPSGCTVPREASALKTAISRVHKFFRVNKASGQRID